MQRDKTPLQRIIFFQNIVIMFLDTHLIDTSHGCLTSITNLIILQVLYTDLHKLFCLRGTVQGKSTEMSLICVFKTNQQAKKMVPKHSCSLCLALKKYLSFCLSASSP